LQPVAATINRATGARRRAESNILFPPKPSLYLFTEWESAVSAAMEATPAGASHCREIVPVPLIFSVTDVLAVTGDFSLMPKARSSRTTGPVNTDIEPAARQCVTTPHLLLSTTRRSGHNEKIG
jgi:hypothetical protein